MHQIIHQYYNQEIEKLMSNKNRMNQRVKSVGLLSVAKTIAEENLVSMKQSKQAYFINKPVRIRLPQYFNIPKFIDKKLQYFSSSIQTSKQFLKINVEKGLRQKLKDLSLLAEGMKRAKNIRQQSRYYFIQGVLLHNAQMYPKSLQMFQKFLKIVLFIKDDKSIQLALNSIGIAFMYMNVPQSAREYHRKQSQINQNSQKFIGVINLGLCYQIQNNAFEAYHHYSSLKSQKNVFELNKEKQQFLNKLLQRVESSQYQSNFLTQNSKQNKNKQEYQADRSLNKSNRNKSGSNLFRVQMKKSSSNTQYQKAKINYAISSAQQNISDFINQFRQSIMQEDING